MSMIGKKNSKSTGAFIKFNSEEEKKAALEAVRAGREETNRQRLEKYVSEARKSLKADGHDESDTDWAEKLALESAYIAQRNTTDYERGKKK